MRLAWKDVEKYIIDGLKYADDKYTLDDIKQALNEHSMILWVVYNDVKARAIGCLLTETLQYPQLKCLSIFLLGSDDFDEMVTMLDELREYGRGIGCKTLEFYGRAGWEKRLKPHGFEKIHIVMRDIL